MNSTAAARWEWSGCCGSSFCSTGDSYTASLTAGSESAKPLRQKRDPQYDVEPHRLASRLPLRVTRLHQEEQLSPRHDGVHFFQKLFAPGLLRVALKLCLMGQRYLPHSSSDRALGTTGRADRAVVCHLQKYLSPRRLAILLETSIRRHRQCLRPHRPLPPATTLSNQPVHAALNQRFPRSR